MIPRVAAHGRSFKGAGLYYLHDKGHAATSERVVLTHTENLPTRDPEKALKCMAWTAMNAQTIKVRAGGKATGRKLTVPVYTYSLAWSPEQQPSHEQMIEAARETLRVLGLTQHEALFIAHDDTHHPHIHVIVNRVHPGTGIAAPVKMDFLRLSQWAEDYELRNGKILCEQRVENNRRRQTGEYVKYEEETREQALARWRRNRAKEAFEQSQAEAGSQQQQHRDERRALLDQKQQGIASRRATIREQARPHWKELYAQQKAERANLRHMQKLAAERLRQAYRTNDPTWPGAQATKSLLSMRNPQPVPGPLSPPKGRRATKDEKRQARTVPDEATGPVRAGDWLRANKEERSGYLRESFQLSSAWAMELAQRQKEERAAFAAHLKRLTDRQLREVKEHYTKDLTSLKDRQREGARALTRRHAEESMERARELKEGRDREAFLREAQRGLPTRDMNEAAQGPLKPPVSPAEPPVRKPQSLSERFRGVQERAAGKTEPLGVQQPPSAPAKRGSLKERFSAAGDRTSPHPSKEPKAPRTPTEHRRAEFREAAKDITDPKKQAEADKSADEGKGDSGRKMTTAERFAALRENRPDITKPGGRSGRYSPGDDRDEPFGTSPDRDSGRASDRGKGRDDGPELSKGSPTAPKPKGPNKD